MTSTFLWISFRRVLSNAISSTKIRTLTTRPMDEFAITRLSANRQYVHEISLIRFAFERTQFVFRCVVTFDHAVVLRLDGGPRTILQCLRLVDRPDDFERRRRPVRSSPQERRGLRAERRQLKRGKIEETYVVYNVLVYN